jgi:hypothetical protein
MVAKRIKSLIIEELAKPSGRCISRSLRFFAVRYPAHTFCTVCSGHKLAKRFFWLEGGESV